MDTREETLARLGKWSLLPFAIGAAGVWLSPWILPGGFGFDLGEITLIYAGIVASYIAGVGAGGILTGGARSASDLAAGLIAAAVAWFAIWPVGALFVPMTDIARYLLVIGVFVYLWMRDTRAVADGALPPWYGALRTRHTFWVCLGLALIMSRLLV